MQKKKLEPVYHPVNLNSKENAQKAYETYKERYPDIINGYSEYQRARTLEDFSYHLQYIEESIAVSDAAILIDYTKWAKVLLASLGLPENCLRTSLEVVRDVLDLELPEEQSKKTHEYIEKSLAALIGAPTTIPSFITDDNPLKQEALKYLDFLLLQADRTKARNLVVELVNQGVSVRDVYLFIYQPILHEVGRLWQLQKISVAQEHYVTASTQQILAQFYFQYIARNKNIIKRGKTVVTACVSGELHELGIRMVADFFEMDGWNSYHIGANSPLQSIETTIRERKAVVVAISSTMSFHIPKAFSLIQSLRESPDTRNIIIIIGGYPFNIVPDLWQQIGANAYAKDAEEAVSLSNELVP